MTCSLETNFQCDLPAATIPYNWPNCTFSFLLPCEVQRPWGLQVYIWKTIMKNFKVYLSSSSQVYPRPDNTVYVCAGGSKDSLPVPLDPAKVRATNSYQQHTKESIMFNYNLSSPRWNKILTPLRRCCRWPNRWKSHPPSYPGDQVNSKSRFTRLTRNLKSHPPFQVTRCISWPTKYPGKLPACCWWLGTKCMLPPHHQVCIIGGKPQASVLMSETVILVSGRYLGCLASTWQPATLAGESSRWIEV